MFAGALALCAQGAGYWPFGADEDSTNAPPRLHRLLEPANDYIELAQDASLNGDSDKAIENYRLALGELDRVEAEHPDRAETSEFAPLRLRRAACTAAIDAIRFAQVTENVRPVSVTDTTELQKRWNKAHGIVDEDETAGKERKGAAPPPKEEPEPAPPPKEEPEPAPPAKEESKPAPPAAKRPTSVSADWNERIAQAMADIRAQDYAAADVLLESMLKERPKDLNALLLRAAAQTGTKSYYAAQRTLERAMRAHPRSYLPYYNLANVVIRQNGDLEVAREYYELGRTVGGPANKALEARLKGAGK
jgi:tetratricopeptide (TPR) repeat protein